MSDDERFASSTQAVHAGTDAERAHHTLAPSIAQTATFTFDSTADLERYMRGEDGDPDREEYGRYGNPTVREVERRVAELEGTDDAVGFASGMAALSSVTLALLKADDHVVLFRDCYRRTRQLVMRVLERFGIQHSLVAPGAVNELRAAMTPRTRLVIAESPTNPYLYCTDLDELNAVVKAQGRVRTLIDSTFATPINLRPARYGIELVAHSATKYLAGHNDVLGGFVAGPSHLISLIREMRGVLGGILDPHAAFLIGRGIKTLALRVQQQNQTAAEVAIFLSQHPGVARVYYPGLETHPTHAIAARQMRGFGGVVSFVAEGGRAHASKIVDACKLARIAPSLGGVETLIEQPAIMSYFELDDAGLAEVGIDPGLIRLAVGVEDSADVVADLAQALQIRT
ncbi:MAG TPA: aminotransferase class I/II-fold pyridoxal phosphate-dependent enzyme [Polyangiaceae bacterium]|nr:aminotransferase class I/II-fold pyridoxal phosphate-dependent enzyme [Polyangiaceae bacterium]